MGLQHCTQDISKIPLKYHKKVLFYTKYTHPTLICRGTHGRTDARTDGRTHARKIFTQYSGISSCSVGSTDLFGAVNTWRAPIAPSTNLLIPLHFIDASNCGYSEAWRRLRRHSKALHSPPEATHFGGVQQAAEGAEFAGCQISDSGRH
jgi:hypothetical protein